MLKLHIIIIQVDSVNLYKLIIKKMEWYMGKYLIIQFCVLLTCYHFIFTFFMIIKLLLEVIFQIILNLTQL